MLSQWFEAAPSEWLRTACGYSSQNRNLTTAIERFII